MSITKIINTDISSVQMEGGQEEKEGVKDEGHPQSSGTVLTGLQFSADKDTGLELL